VPCSFCVLELQPSVVNALVDKGVKHVVYLIHANVDTVQLAVQHIKMVQK
jgi:hypothetical protein